MYTYYSDPLILPSIEVSMDWTWRELSAEATVRQGVLFIAE